MYIYRLANNLINLIDLINTIFLDTTPRPAMHFRFFLATAPRALCTTLTLHLPVTPNPYNQRSTTHATLSSLGVQAQAPLSRQNTLVFSDVAPGSYLLDVHSQTDAYHPLRIDVANDGSVAAWETFRGNDWDNVGEALPVSNSGLELRWLGHRQYYMDRPGFSLLGILQSPMILMGLVSLLILVGLPYLMDNMDPEIKAEMEAQRKGGGPMAAMMSGNPQAGNPLGDFDMAAFLAGSKKKESAAPQSVAASPAKEQGVRR